MGKCAAVGCQNLAFGVADKCALHKSGETALNTSGHNKSAWLQKVQDNSDAVAAKSHNRAEFAQEWTNKELRKLVEWIKKLGTPNSDKKLTVKFGVLFKATVNDFEALSGNLKTAKKRRINTFGPDLLFERTHDDVLITLLREDVEDTAPTAEPKPKPAAPNPAVAKKGAPSSSDPSGNDVCGVCAKKVYAMERVGAGKLVYHKACFTCADCKKKLDPKLFCSVAGRVFCKACYMNEINRVQSEQRKDD